MSAPDDKISSNRRRLFKALSTAPVVMTLKPGAALANASSVHCAANIRNGTTPIGMDELGPTDVNVAVGWEQHGVWVKNRWAWWFTTNSRVEDPSSTGDYVSLDGTNITTAQLTAGFVVVAVGPAVSSDPFELGVDGTSTDVPRVATNDTRTDVTSYSRIVDGVLEIINSDDIVCLRSATSEGLDTGGLAGFAVIGRSVEEGGVADRKFVVDGIYPQEVPGGDLQALNGTCLDSFRLADAGDSKTLSIG